MCALVLPLNWQKGVNLFRIFINFFLPGLLFLFISNFSAAAEAKISFKKSKIKVANQVLEVELAETQAQHERGLMFRTELKDGHGMLFIFEDYETRAFWMKNTFVPLSIAYFDTDKKLVNMLDMKPAMSSAQTEFPNYPSEGPAKYALEVPQGWFKRKGIKKGASFSFVKD